MNKKRIVIWILLLCLILGCCAFLGWRIYYHATYIYINDVRYLRAETQLDLSEQGYPELAAITQMENLQLLDLRGTGLTADDYDLLCQALPDCRILWDIPFQGSYYDENTSHLTVTELNAEDLEQLAYFKQLREINAESCRNYEAILDLQTRYPGCKVTYFVRVGGEAYGQDTTDLIADSPVMEEIELALKYLTKLRYLHLSGELPTAEELNQLVSTYPNTEITWEKTVCGVSFLSNATEMDISDIPVESVETVESVLGYFPQLERVIMCRCGIPSAEMDALNKRHDNIRFVWSVFVGTAELRTDVTVFMPYQYGYAGTNKMKDEHTAELKYCTDLVALDMGHMYISDISFLYHMPNMKYLILAETFITDITPVGSLKELVYFEMFITNVTDFSPLLGCTKLEDLNMCWTWPANLEVLKDLPNLKNLWLVGAYYPQSALQQVQEAHPNATYAVAERGSSTGRGWRQLPNYFAQRDLLNMGYMTG